MGMVFFFTWWFLCRDMRFNECETNQKNNSQRSFILKKLCNIQNCSVFEHVHPLKKYTYFMEIRDTKKIIIIAKTIGPHSTIRREDPGRGGISSDEGLDGNISRFHFHRAHSRQTSPQPWSVSSFLNISKTAV